MSAGDQPGWFLQVLDSQLSRTGGRKTIFSTNGVFALRSFSRVTNIAHRHSILTSSTSEWLGTPLLSKQQATGPLLNEPFLSPRSRVTTLLVLYKHPRTFSSPILSGRHSYSPNLQTWCLRPKGARKRLSVVDGHGSCHGPEQCLHEAFRVRRAPFSGRVTLKHYGI